MYGLVNRAVVDLVHHALGPDGWERVRARAGLEIDTFLSMESYEDEITYRLVAAASAEANLPPERVLELFGEHWVGYAVAHGYRELMSARGQTLFEFLVRLDDMHARLSLTFPALRPPSFRASDRTERSLRLHYFSERVGLGPMVVGLLRGLGKHFGTNVDIRHERRKDEGDDHDEFVVTLA